MFRKTRTEQNTRQGRHSIVESGSSTATKQTEKAQKQVVRCGILLLFIESNKLLQKLIIIIII